ncbi:dTDP-4-keto-6-deoxy-D-glucose epimerase [Candidatus Parcubacteria bacterium]|nr:MAG: dTDP-4-keto-6-deoxy-D-glucose epimerase [Candidatus Parcubacteria bacterium]
MSSQLRFEPTNLDGLFLIHRAPIGDSRGFLQRVFCDQLLHPVLKGQPIRQVNHTKTQFAGTIRGMHFQHEPFAEKKLITCLKGGVFDVIIDLRAESKTYMQTYTATLTSEGSLSLLVPEGCAHGFQTLQDDTEMLYLHTAPYDSESEGGVNALDPIFGIQWPLPVVERSVRDANHALIDSNFEGVRL